MPKKKKIKKSSFNYSLFKNRPGFYSLITVLVLLMLTAINQYGAANFERDVLGEKDRSEQSQASKPEHREEKADQSDKKPQQEQQNIELKRTIERKYEINPDRVKIEYRPEKSNSQIERKVEFKDEERNMEDELKKALGNDIEEAFESENDLEIASDSSDVTIKKNHVKARSGFPLTLDAATNQLMVTRPDGTTKLVSVLPDKAVENFMRHKKINLINFEEPGTGSGSGEIDNNVGSESAENVTEQTQISLVDYDDQLAYEIKGKKKVKVLGLIPVDVDTKGYVSAETGDVLAQEEPLLTQFLNLFSL